MKRKLTAIILTAVMTFSLAGCAGSDTPETPDTDISTETDAEQTAQTTDGTDTDGADAVLDKLREMNAGNTVDPAEAAPDENGERILSRSNSERYFYSVNSAGETTTFDRDELIDSIGDRGSRYVRLYDKDYGFYTGDAIAYDGRFLYFRTYEKVGTDTDNSYVVFAIDTTDYEPYLVWRSQPGDNAYIDTIEYYKGALHISVNRSRDSDGNMSERFENCYTFDEAGKKFTETSAGLEAMFDASISSNLNLIGRMDYDGSSKECYSHTIDDIGWVLALYDGEFARITGDGEVISIAPPSDDNYPNIASYDNKYIYFSDWDSKTYQYMIYCYDIGRERSRALTLPTESATVLGYLDGSLYYSIENVPEYGYPVQTIYSYCGDDGRSVELYEASAVAGAQFTPGIDGFRIIGDRMYYIGFDTDRLEWVSADAHTPFDKPESTGCVVEELSVFKYGRVESDSATGDCPYCGTPLFKYYAENFVLDSKYSSNADKINAFLKDKREAFLGHNDSDVYAPTDDSDCEYHLEYPQQNCITDDMNVGSVHMLGSKYMTVDMNGYWYGGGAHGSPNRAQYLFDLGTGDLLTIADIYTGTEEDYRKTIAEATKADFERYTYETSPYFASDAQEVYDQAYDEASLENPNVEFGEDGLTVVYPPYDMGPYASGYIEIFVPYKDLNIDLK